MAIENVVLVSFEEGRRGLPGGNRPPGGERRGAHDSTCGGVAQRMEDGTA